MAKIHLNGRLIEATAARIDPADRGLLLADGLFETLRVYGGRAFQLEAHLARLAAGDTGAPSRAGPATIVSRASKSPAPAPSANCSAETSRTSFAHVGH